MLVQPTLIVEDVTAIDLTLLQSYGIQGFIFDLDNTIMAPNSGHLDEHVKAWLLDIQARGFRCIVVSNNHRTAYIQEVEAILNFPAIGNAKKPRRKFLRKALELLGLEPEKVVVVGDRPLTDIWGGQRLGAHTILVEPLTKTTESPLIQCLRRLERLFVKAAKHG